MSDSLEVKKLRAELSRVTAAKFEMDLRIAERSQEIEQLVKHMAVQEEKEKELTIKMAELNK